MSNTFTTLPAHRSPAATPHAPGSPRLSLFPARRGGKPWAASSLIRISELRFCTGGSRFTQRRQRIGFHNSQPCERSIYAMHPLCRSESARDHL
jgi:hypothetical protein